eukprot:1191195-Prorocentrum_minimum.AAC.1
MGDETNGPVLQVGEWDVVRHNHSPDPCYPRCRSQGHVYPTGRGSSGPPTAYMDGRRALRELYSLRDP